jgi:hypothetical protein
MRYLFALGKHRITACCDVRKACRFRTPSMSATQHVWVWHQQSPGIVAAAQ